MRFPRTCLSEDLCTKILPTFQLPTPIAPPGRGGLAFRWHGTVNLLLFLVVHTGQMEVAVEATKDADHYIRELRAFRRRHRHLKGVLLIQDGDPSHTAGDTKEYWSGCQGWWRRRFTPAHASWLNQAELLVGAFGYHYLKRDSWGSREEFVEHVLASGPEYNWRYAHPFDWTWTNQQMRVWFAKHAH